MRHRKEARRGQTIKVSLPSSDFGLNFRFIYDAFILYIIILSFRKELEIPPKSAS